MSTAKSISIEEIKEAIQKILKTKYKFALLLGSAATERFNKGSDIDIAIFFDQEEQIKDLSKFNLKLADHFDREVDLIQLNKIDPIFARQVLETGREIDIVDRAAFNL